MYELVDRTVDILPIADRTRLNAMRRWVHALTLTGSAPVVEDERFGDVMLTLADGSSETLTFQRPCYATVEETEAVILAIWRLADNGRSRRAQDAAAAVVDAAFAGRLVEAMGHAAD